jgi:integrase
MLCKLKAIQVDRLHKPGRYGDGGNLWLQVRTARHKSWLFRYTINGRAREMGLGAFPDVSLAEARDRARFARLAVSAGRDPLDERRNQRAELRRAEAATKTFKECALALIASREATWGRESYRQWTSTLSEHAYPVFGNLPVAAIDTPLVMKAVEPLWKRAQVTADRLRQRIEAVLDWATAGGYRSGDNPARWRGHLQHLLPDIAKVEHLAALPYTDVPAFMAALRAREGVAPRALEFTILTAVRTGESLGAQWDEIADDVWTVPATRTKIRKDHAVPLVPAVLKLLDGLPREGGFVFPGWRGDGRPLERHAMADLMKAMGVTVTVHGFRSSFRDWAAECTSYPREVCEMALAHSIPNRIEASYRRGDLLEKRRRLMNEWSKYCAAPRPAGKVVKLRQAR